MRIAMNNVMISLLSGVERDGWLAPQLVDRCFQAIGDAAAQRRQLAMHMIQGYRPVEKARNEAVLRFLQLPQDFQWLIQIDNDTIPPEHFMHVIEKAEHEMRYVFGVPCPMTIGRERIAWNFAIDPDNSKTPLVFSALPPGWNKSDYLGGAFLAVRRPVLEKIKSNWFNPISPLGEDFSFCQRVRVAGFQPWFHGDYHCDHYHTVSLLAALTHITDKKYAVGCPVQ